MYLGRCFSLERLHRGRPVRWSPHGARERCVRLPRTKDLVNPPSTNQGLSQPSWQHARFGARKRCVRLSRTKDLVNPRTPATHKGLSQPSYACHAQKNQSTVRRTHDSVLENAVYVCHAQRISQPSSHAQRVWSTPLAAGWKVCTPTKGKNIYGTYDVRPQS